MERRKVLLVTAVAVALVGALLVFVYAQSAGSKASGAVGGTSKVLVVSQAITAGESADSLYADGKIREANVPNAALVPGATDNGAAFSGQVALTDLYPGEQLIPQKFGSVDDVQTKSIINVPSGYLTFTIDLADVNHVGPFLQPGQHVALWYVPNGAVSGATSFQGAKVLVPDVLVVSVGNEIPASQSVDAQGNTIATAPTTTIGIAAPPDQVSTIGGAAFTQTGTGSQTLFMTLLNGKTKLQTDSYFKKGS